MSLQIFLLVHACVILHVYRHLCVFLYISVSICMNFGACFLVHVFYAFLRVEACLLLLECGCDLCACSFVCIVPYILVRVCTFMSCMMGHA